MTTLLCLHQSIVNDLQKDIDNIPLIELENNELITLKNELCSKTLEQRTIEEFDKIYEIDEKIRSNIEKINKLRKSINNYYLLNGELLNEYEDFENKSSKKIITVNIKDICKKKKYKVLNDVMGQDKNTKADFLKEYLSKNKQDYISLQESTITEDNYCIDCQAFRILKPSESKNVCEFCNTEVNIIMDYEKPSIKDPPMEVRYYEYQRIKHFCDWLANLQGKESSEVPEEIITLVQLEIRKHKNLKLEDLDEEDIRNFIKKNAKKINGTDRYYEHVTQILFKVTGIPPLTMTPEQEENLKIMFILIQEPYNRFVIAMNRKNIFSYSCIIYKFCQLLGYTDFMKKLKLLKEKEKLNELDTIWRKICKFMGDGWTFHKFY